MDKYFGHSQVCRCDKPTRHFAICNGVIFSLFSLLLKSSIPTISDLGMITCITKDAIETVYRLYTSLKFLSVANKLVGHL